MITLIPINKNIQKTLHEKIGMLGKQDLPNPNEPQTDEKGVAPENYMFTRVPFLRAVSFTQKKKTENKINTEALARSLIILISLSISFVILSHNFSIAVFIISNANNSI